MNLFTDKNVSPPGQVNERDLQKIGWNIVVFTAPVFAVFFAQLSLGVEPKKAALVALLGLYGVLADFFKKLQDGTK